MTHSQSYLRFLPSHIQTAIQSLPDSDREQVEEIRLRIAQPLQLRTFGQMKTLVQCSIQYEDIRFVLQMATQSSLYAVEEELRQGYITVSGGHRIGVAGRAVVDENRHVETLRDIRFLNLRISREVQGVANRLIPYLVDTRKSAIFSTLIISPPGCGKTTLLRDLTRQISNGLLSNEVPPLRVSLVDERSELAGSFQGIPQLDVGRQTDVLDACPKAQGMMMMIRSMSPDVVVTDEIGRPEDVEAILEATHAGVIVLATAHGLDLADVYKRPQFQALHAQGVFGRYVILSRRHHQFVTQAVLDEKGHVATPSSLIKAAVAKDLLPC